ncbi:Cof-type HAD-IIB family hydrolase [Flavobacteriaceae bacterium AU392]|nr:HAD family phosphatase [Flavobacteriaceae bacterium]RKM81386.1 Cof-type HAD-IIB family hydrolase [Flavobacteriaceae bacterium AU392]
MDIKLICSDIDGTLLNKDRQLSQRTITAIKNNAKTPFILISSRMPKAMLHLQQELDITQLPMIAYNGGLVIDNGSVLHTTEININTTRSITDFCKGTQIHTSLYHNDEWFVPEMDYWAKREQNNTKVTPTVNPIENTILKWGTENKGSHKIMCMGDEKEIDSLSIFLKEHFSNEVIGYRSKPTYLEISHKDISKKTAIEFLLQSKYNDLDLKHILAFGDNYNDIEMLESVGFGVAVENAKEEVLAVSNATTLSNKEDGVAIFMEDYLK